jgi:hypothetical protein
MSLAWRICIPMAAAVALFACSSQPEPAPARPQEGSEGSSQTAADSQKEFVVTPELYNRTFDEVKAVIAELTLLISSQDYEGWRSYLTADYITRTSDSQFLKRASSSGVLQKNGIVLHSLKDYFENVVVRSRVQATLTDITFVDKNHVKAMTVIDGNPVILYYLVHEDGRWKVGIWPTEQE